MIYVGIDVAKDKHDCFITNSDTSYHNEKLKSLTRYRFDKVNERAKLKTSGKLVPPLYIVSIYALLPEFLWASKVASAYLTRLTHLLQKSSYEHYNKDTSPIPRCCERLSEN